MGESLAKTLEANGVRNHFPQHTPRPLALFPGSQKRVYTMPIIRLGLRPSGQQKSRGCYCDTPTERVHSDLKIGTVPDEALVRKCCYKWICKVRGSYRFGLPDGGPEWEEEAEAWQELCAKKGYLFGRQNPRGF